MKCERCGSTRITTQEARNPCDPIGGFRITARCNNCLFVFVPELRTNPSPSVPDINSQICKKSANPQPNTANMTNLAEKTDKNGKNQEISDHAAIAVDWAFSGDKPTIPFAIHSAIIDALDHAKTKHPHFADTDAEAGTVIAEELLEVNTAALQVMQGINDQASRDNLFVELAQLNATTIRMMEKLLK